MEWLVPILLLILAIEFIVFLIKGFLGIILGIIFCVFPVYFLFKWEKEFPYETILTILIILNCVSFVALLVYTDYIKRSEYFKGVKEAYEEGDYPEVINKVSNAQYFGGESDRIYKLKSDAIEEWIKECEKINNDECIDKMVNTAQFDYDLSIAMKKAFNINVDEYLEKKAREQVREQYSASEPTYGMEEEYINITSWGPPNEKVIKDNAPRANITTYTWYFCENNRQYSRHVTVQMGKVIYVSPEDAGVEVDSILPRFLKCTK